MDDTIMVQMPLILMAEIRRALKECGEDLQGEVLAKHGKPPYHPATDRACRRDMASGDRALFMAACLDGQPWAYNHPGWRDLKI